ncbi:MAG: glutaredoxin 3 [Candidatus Azotimanducaceae bacterium]|jgi:glutaredoxin 3
MTIDTNMNTSVLMYTTRFCPFCVRAKSLLDHKHVTYEEISVDSDPDKRREMMTKAGQHTVPQIWIGNTHVGGCDELFMLERAGKLDALLQGIR